MPEQDIIRESNTTNEGAAFNANPSAEKSFSINDIDMRPDRDRNDDRNKIDSSLPAGFNHIEISTVDKVADKGGFITKESLDKASKDPTLDEVQKDDVKHMLDNFQILADKVDDKDGGKKEFLEKI